jgi:hypothetical protein
MAQADDLAVCLLHNLNEKVLEHHVEPYVDEYISYYKRLQNESITLDPSFGGMRVLTGDENKYIRQALGLGGSSSELDKDTLRFYLNQLGVLKSIIENRLGKKYPFKRIELDGNYQETPEAKEMRKKLLEISPQRFRDLKDILGDDPPERAWDTTGFGLGGDPNTAALKQMLLPYYIDDRNFTFSADDASTFMALSLLLNKIDQIGNSVKKFSNYLKVKYLNSKSVPTDQEKARLAQLQEVEKTLPGLESKVKKVLHLWNPGPKWGNEELIRNRALSKPEGSPSVRVHCCGGGNCGSVCPNLRGENRGQRVTAVFSPPPPDGLHLEVFDLAPLIMENEESIGTQVEIDNIRGSPIAEWYYLRRRHKAPLVGQ